MARINIPKPISTYRDLGTVELAKLARNQYIEGYSAADEFSNSVHNMQSLSKDDHLKNKLSNEYTQMLEGWSDRGDYETLGIAINKGANQFVRDYSPIEQSVKSRTEYQERLQKAYEDGNINSRTLRDRLAQSDYMYQGIQYGEDGSLDQQSVYSGKQFYNDVDITEKVIERMKSIKPFIRENLGTEVPYNENMEITTTQGLRGEPKYWVTTKGKTSQIPDNIIQMVVNDVMSDPDVSASLAQQVELDTYQLGETDPTTGNSRALDYITKLINKGDVKQEEIAPIVEQMGPLVALQNLLYQDAVNRETQLAIGSYGGVRQQSYGQTIEIDDLYELNYKAKIDKAKKITTSADDELSYSATVSTKALTTTFEEGEEMLENEIKSMKSNLSKVSQHLNVNPDNIQYDDQGNEIPSKGEGLAVGDMDPRQIYESANQLVDAWRTASAKANIIPLDYMGWRNSGKVPSQGEEEGQDEYLARLDEAYNGYVNNLKTQSQAGLTYLQNTAAINDLDVGQFNSLMEVLSSNATTYDVIDSKLYGNIDGLSVPNTEGYGNNLSVADFKDIRGNQLLGAEMGHENSDLKISGQDIVDAYNYMAANDMLKLEMEGERDLPKSISHLGELPEMFYSGNIFESFAFAGNSNENIHGLIGALAEIKRGQGYKVAGTYQRGTGEYTWAGVDNGYRFDEGNQQYSFNLGIQEFINQLNDDTKLTKDKFKEQYANSEDVMLESFVITNFGSNYETSSIAKNELVDFFKGNAIPPNFSIREAQGQSPNLEFEGGFINSENGESNHFGYNVEYNILEDQMGVLNVQLGDDGVNVYVPIKITNSPPSNSNATDHKGKVFNMLIPTKNFNLPALSQYVNSAEMEINTLWNMGVANRNTTWSPKRYSNVTFNYNNETVVINGEEHSKQKGLSILVQNELNRRNIKQ